MNLLSNSLVTTFWFFACIGTFSLAHIPNTNTITNVDSICRNTHYLDACKWALASELSTSKITYQELFEASVMFTINYTLYIQRSTHNLTPPHYDPINDCVELLDDTLEHLTNVLHPDVSHDDIETWLSAALTNQETCLESLASNTLKMPKEEISMSQECRNLSQFIGNSLALFKSTNHQWGVGVRRNVTSKDLPEWLTSEDREVLEETREGIKADAVVAMDGSGTHKSINEALAYVSSTKRGCKGGKHHGRIIIHIKAGRYHEYVRIPTKQKNVMLMGDGKGRSFIIGNRSHRSGWSTYQSATVAANGAGFIARDLTIINNAGSGSEQAVALRVGADRAVVYRCSIEGHQDTLYVHSNRQFYLRNVIYGTVDFIFGNAAAILQNCRIRPRKPEAAGKKNTITAQGRSDPNQNTGIIIQRCRIVATPDLDAVKKHGSTYLGRPWRRYSRVVIMESKMDDSIHPKGWLQWSDPSALATLFYGEHRNSGPGASTSHRVRWAGVHPKLSKAEAARFTVDRFLAGRKWLKGIGLRYKPGL